jgi:methionine-rich copper-binding protein CopC
MSTRKTLSGALVLGAAAAFVSLTQAAAHASLVKSDPAEGATVPAPQTITLSFDEELTPAFSGFDVTMGGSMKVPVKTTVSADHKSITGVLLGGHQMAGAYKISWHAAAADDGHRSKGDVTFTVK